MLFFVVQMDHLACFIPGMLVLGAEGPKAEEYLQLAKEVHTALSRMDMMMIVMVMRVMMVMMMEMVYDSDNDDNHDGVYW